MFCGSIGRTSNGAQPVKGLGGLCRQLAGPLLAQFLFIGEFVRVGRIGHGHLVGEPRFLDLKRDRHIKNGPPMLDCHHPTGGEAAAVTNSVHGVEDGRFRVSAAQEIAVHGVGVAVFGHGA